MIEIVAPPLRSQGAQIERACATLADTASNGRGRRKRPHRLSTPLPPVQTHDELFL